MNFEHYQSQTAIKNYLENSLKENRVSHALLMVGKAGWGTLPTALWYAQQVLCEGKENCNQKVNKLIHPDLHFSIPTFKLDNKEALTKNYIQQFREMILENPYADINEWYARLEAGNKQGFLSKKEIDEVMSSLSLKSYEGGYKVMIIWNADKMKVDYANKLLKLLEEPPEKTLFILLSENEERLLDTILSRCVKLDFKPLTDDEVRSYLKENKDLSEEQIDKMVKHSFGDFNKAKQLSGFQENKSEFENEFVDWNRAAYMAKKDYRKLKDLIIQSEKIASWSTEKQKSYISFCLEVFRSGLLQNYQVGELTFSEVEEGNFNFENFSRFIHGSNIEAILEDLNNAYYYLERNANKKLVFTNLSISLTRHIHTKAKAI